MTKICFQETNHHLVTRVTSEHGNSAFAVFEHFKDVMHVDWATHSRVVLEFLRKGTITIKEVLQIKNTRLSFNKKLKCCVHNVFKDRSWEMSFRKILLQTNNEYFKGCYAYGWNLLSNFIFLFLELDSLSFKEDVT